MTEKRSSRGKLVHFPVPADTRVERYVGIKNPSERELLPVPGRIVSFVAAMRDRYNVLPIAVVLKEDEISDEERYRRLGRNLVIDFPLTAPTGFFAVYESLDESNEVLRKALIEGASEAFAEVVLGYPDSIDTPRSQKYYQRRVSQEKDFLTSLALLRREIGSSYVPLERDRIPAVEDLLNIIDYIRYLDTRVKRRKKAIGISEERAKRNLVREELITEEELKWCEKELEYLQNGVWINRVIHMEPINTRYAGYSTYEESGEIEDK